MLDANDLVRAVKKASTDANDAGYPVNVMTGSVTSTNPLSVKVEQRFEIGRNQLIVPEYLTDHKVKISMGGDTEMDGEPEHAHGLGGKREMTIYNGLKSGDQVMLVRQQGGQKFLVIDRVI